MNNQELLPEVAALLSRPGEPEGFHQSMVHLYRGVLPKTTMWGRQVLEANYFSGQLCPSSTGEKTSWREEIAKDLERPCFTTGTFMALRMRLRSNYLLLVYFVSAVWLAKVFVHPRRTAHLP